MAGNVKEWVLNDTERSLSSEEPGYLGRMSMATQSAILKTDETAAIAAERSNLTAAGAIVQTIASCTGRPHKALPHVAGDRITEGLPTMGPERVVPSCKSSPQVRTTLHKKTAESAPLAKRRTASNLPEPAVDVDFDTRDVGRIL
jgi:hypothetical protein